MPEENTRKKGRSAEGRAAEYLITEGYQVITRNYQTRAGEIDIIAEDPEEPDIADDVDETAM
jgi:putative endonuclease